MSTPAQVLILLLAIASAAQAPPRDNSVKEQPQLVSDFQLECDLRDRAGNAITDNVVHDFVRFDIHGAERIVGTHDLVVSIDGAPVLSRSDIRFPYQLTWNFKGLLNGTHTVFIVFTSTENKRGLVQLNLTVQH